MNAPFDFSRARTLLARFRDLEEAKRLMLNPPGPENASPFATAAEEHFREIVSGIEDYAIFLLDARGHVASWNAGAQRLKGYQAEEIIGKHFSIFYPPETLQRGLPEYVLNVAAQTGRSTDEGWRMRQDGSRFWAHVTITALKTPTGAQRGFLKITRDLTERKQAEQQLKESLEREAILRRELHHRVKNNLQVISSLLFLQSSHVTDPATLEILRESQGRARAIALIHEKLYRSADLARIDVCDYARQLADDLFHAYGVSPETVSLEIHAEGVSLGIDVAIPCGLILNELVSNALKHGLPAGRKGAICIELQPTSPGSFMLSVGDNGAGLPDDFDLQTTKTLGLKLVSDLARQLGGAVAFERNHGTAVKITFVEPLYGEQG